MIITIDINACAQQYNTNLSKSKRRRVESFETCCRWALLNVQNEAIEKNTEAIGEKTRDHWEKEPRPLRKNPEAIGKKTPRPLKKNPETIEKKNEAIGTREVCRNQP